MFLSTSALPGRLPRCARHTFANFVCDPCIATTAYDRHHNSPLSRDSPHDSPADSPPCAMTHHVFYPVFMPCPTTTPLSGPLS